MSVSRPLRLGTRGSALALAQSQMTADALTARFHATLAPGMEFTPRYNAVPVQKLPVILNEHPEEITIATLGLVAEGVRNLGEQPYHIVGAGTVAMGQHFHQAFATRR